MKQGKQLYVFINQSAKHILFLLGLFFAMTSFAQTQQGYVKTKGRMVDGKHVPGQGLSGAIVSIQDRTSVSVQNDDGSFSFPIPAKTFIVKSVQKNGYELVDADVIRKPYNYSTNPIYLVMETPKQQLQDQLDSERKIRRTLQRQLQKRENELDALKEAHEITLEEYQQSLQKLYAEQENNEKFIANMAKKYAQLDFDQIEGSNKKLREYILNGELKKADSLLNAKGDINADIEEYNRVKAMNAKTKEELAQSMAFEQWRLEDLAQRCYNKFEISKMIWNDSAEYWIRKRADLDTTNLIWQKDAAFFIGEFSPDDALLYCQRGLRQAILQFGEQSEEVASIYMLIGDEYFDKGMYDTSIIFMEKSLHIYESIFGEMNSRVADLNRYIGEMYPFIHSDGYSYLEKSLEINLSIFGERHKSVALSYFSLGRSLPSLYYLNKAMEISESLELDSITALCWEERGNYYSYRDSYSQAIDCYDKALVIWQSLYGEIHSHIAFEYLHIADELCRQNRFNQSLDYYQRSLAIAKEFFGEKHSLVAMIYCNYGLAYSNIGELSNAIELLNISLEIWQTIYGEEHPQIALAYTYLGHCYAKYLIIAKRTADDLKGNGIDIQDELTTGFYLMAKESYEKALTIYRNRDDNQKVLLLLDYINGLEHSFKF